MTSQVKNIDIYCKIAFTEQTATFTVQSNMTIAEFLEYANTYFRNDLNIHESYDIELVQTGNIINGLPELAPPVEPRYDQTLETRYSHIYALDNLVSFYVRPVHPITREFIRRPDYSTIMTYF